ncbi:MAG TPA: hypothetical protein VMR29_00290 [Candidatus Binatia bacterium]|nr:hypothetical protein [Candidatus Binatia bacterium]
MLLFYLVRSGLWRALDREKLRFFLGSAPRLFVSRHYPLWRSLPWTAALFSPRRAREIHAWLEYRVELFDGKAG